MKNDIKEILISSEDIARRIPQMASEISQDYQNKPLSVIILSNGSLFFASDLLRQIPLPLQLDSLAVSSYIGTVSSKSVNFRSELKLRLTDRHILIIDDIYESGLTLRAVSRKIEEENPASVQTCVLLHKECERDRTERPDYIGFDIPDKFVVGYGLDYNETYRNLPYIAVLNEQAVKKGM